MLRSRKAHSVPLRDHMDALLQFRFMPCPVPIWRPRVGRTHLSESPFDVALASPCGAPRRQVLVGLLQHASLMNSQHRARSKRSGRCRDQEGHEGNSLPASAATSPQPRRLAEHTRYPLRFHCRVASILQRDMHELKKLEGPETRVSSRCCPLGASFLRIFELTHLKKEAPSGQHPHAPMPYHAWGWRQTSVLLSAVCCSACVVQSAECGAVGLSYTALSSSVRLIRALGALRGGGFLKKMRKAQPLNQAEKKYWDMAKRVRRDTDTLRGKSTYTSTCLSLHLSAVLIDASAINRASCTDSSRTRANPLEGTWR